MLHSYTREGGRSICLAQREVCNRNGRLKLIYLDGFSFPCEVESKVFNKSENDRVADLKRKENYKYFRIKHDSQNSFEKSVESENHTFRLA